jgi:hypothetical protein
MLRVKEPPSQRIGLPLIWHQPLMAANGNTYAGNMLSCTGFHVPKIDPDGTGYPEVDPATIVDHGITDLFLSSEPHDFTVEEGRTLSNVLADLTPNPPQVHHIDGEDLTWMGTRTLAGLKRLRAKWTQD